jgi:hypothetical protein
MQLTVWTFEAHDRSGSQPLRSRRCGRPRFSNGAAFLIGEIHTWRKYTNHIVPKPDKTKVCQLDDFPFFTDLVTVTMTTFCNHGKEQWWRPIDRTRCSHLAENPPARWICHRVPNQLNRGNTR